MKIRHYQKTNLGKIKFLNKVDIPKLIIKAYQIIQQYVYVKNDLIADKNNIPTIISNYPFYSYLYNAHLKTVKINNNNINNL